MILHFLASFFLVTGFFTTFFVSTGFLTVGFLASDLVSLAIGSLTIVLTALGVSGDLFILVIQSLAGTSVSRANIVALAELILLFDPNDLDRAFLIPATSRIVLATPPAIKPVPGRAGIIRILDPPLDACESVSYTHLTLPTI